MNKNFILFLCTFMCCTMAFSQTTPFPCSTTNPSYVIGFKNGTNCTVAPYNVYTTSLTGTLSSTPLFTTPDTIEVNGIGINPIDNRGYSLWFRRDNNSTPNSCINDTVKLIRFGANGAPQLLGYIAPPAGYTLNTALGTMGANGNYYFGAFINGQLAVGTITNVAALIGGNAALTATYKTVVNNCGGRNFGDWAIRPGTNTLYTYGISLNANNQVTGTVVTIDLNATTVNLVMNCVSGTETMGVFTDGAQDNFGGIMFGADGFMYGVNVNTRRYYRIDASTGAVTLVNTFAGGSGTIRTDMGSCVSVVNPTPFVCTPQSPATVIGFKNGTNCTVAPYSVYTMPTNGNGTPTGGISSTPLFTTPDTIEVNGIGISNIDNFGYALWYRRDNNSTPNSCINDTLKLIRFGANGVVQLLGYIPQPSGLTLSPAVGTIDGNGNYLFTAVINGQISVGKIMGLNALTPGTGALTATYQTVAYNCGGRIFADWAINPLQPGILYSYGIFANANNVVTGGVVTINTNNSPNAILNCVTGTETTGVFFDAAQDNMGGIFFGSDAMMYAVNVNTRRFYRINPNTGAITLLSTIPANGSGTPTTSPMRTDMASCVTTATILPLGFEKPTVVSAGDCKAILSWDVTGVELGDAFVVEKSFDGRNFTTLTTVKGTVGTSRYDITDTKTGITNYYRIKGVSKNGDVKYSPIVRFLSSCGGKNNVTLFSNLITGSTIVTGEVSLYKSQTVTASVYNATGVKVFSKTSTASAGVSRFSYDISSLSKGVYMLQTVVGEERFTEKFIVQ